MPNTVLADPGHPMGAAAERPRRVPLSTYRLQLNTTFTFARAILPYLDRLGISDCYTSPYFAAQPGSTHGYDVGDYNTLNPELGGEAEFNRFVAALGERGMGHVLDFVPNHMGIDPQANPWWRDVLENGPCSPSARFFDIDWAPVKDEVAEKLLLPILGDQYGKVLERGELRLSFADGQLVLDYVDHRLPMNPRQAPRVYRHGLDAIQTALGEEDPHLLEFLSILTALESMPAYTASDPASIAVRRREKEIARRRLAVLVEACPRIREHVEGAVRVFNGEPGRQESFDRLHDLLEAQAYRLAYWRTALHEINYRRFFDINSLAGDYEPLEADVRVPASVVAFARTRGPHALVTLVPRLFASLVHGNRPLPLGGECWNISHVVLPNRLATRKFRNVLTGEFVEPVHTHGEAWLFVGQALQTCPVAILEAVD